MKPTSPTISILRVMDNRSKLNQIIDVVHTHFFKGDGVLIMVPNETAASYIDNLLWQTPAESFLPHAIIRAHEEEKLEKITLKEMIAITTLEENINQATVLINLLPTAPLHLDTFHLIYDLLDHTHPDKTELSLKRHAVYAIHKLPQKR